MQTRQPLCPFQSRGQDQWGVDLRPSLALPGPGPLTPSGKTKQPPLVLPQPWTPSPNTGGVSLMVALSQGCHDLLPSLGPPCACVGDSSAGHHPHCHRLPTGPQCFCCIFWVLCLCPHWSLLGGCPSPSSGLHILSFQWSISGGTSYKKTAVLLSPSAGGGPS